MKKPETISVYDANEAFKKVLNTVITLGDEVTAAESKSVGSGKSFKEIINFHMIIEKPQQRLLRNTKRPINIPGAIARFVWMMAANNRLADIEFYWGPIVTPFTDDGYTIPGSSYGARMFNSTPGLNQVEAVINRLKNDPSTRRAAIAIYHPNDAVRDSKDIPCTFGLFYHIREEKLLSTIVMRSNNAFILLPYNIFEFSLLAEVIAKEVKVSMGNMYYNALSMHIYKEHYEKAQEIINDEEELSDIFFPEMPSEPNPMSEIKKLIILEAKIRHISAGLNNSNINEWLKPSITVDNEEIQLHEYWRQFYYLLLYYIVSKKTSDREALKKVVDLINDPYKKYLNTSDLNIMKKPISQDLFGNTIGNTDFIKFNHYVRKLNSLENHCEEYNNSVQNEEGKIIDFSKYRILREKLVGNPNNMRNIAARNDNPEVSKEEFTKMLAELSDNE